MTTRDQESEFQLRLERTYGEVELDELWVKELLDAADCAPRVKRAALMRGTRWRAPLLAAGAVVAVAVATVSIATSRPAADPMTSGVWVTTPVPTMGVSESMTGVSEVGSPINTADQPLAHGPCGPSHWDRPVLGEVGISWKLGSGFVSFTNTNPEARLRIRETSTPVMIVDSSGVMIGGMTALDSLPQVTLLDSGATYKNSYVEPVVACPSAAQLPDGDYQALVVISIAKEGSDAFLEYRSDLFDVRIVAGHVSL